MRALLFICAALCAYVISGINPAIILSKRIYGQDIRELGSKNPGFTNFKRCFGMKGASVVFVLDVIKSVLPTLIFAVIFEKMYGMWHVGAAFTGLFAVIGHVCPVWYGFKGGKGFLVCIGALWVIDWRVGAISTITLLLLLLTVKYMSLSSMLTLLTGLAALAFFRAQFWACAIYSVCVALVIVRHKENIGRLIRRTEPRFSFFKKEDCR